MNRNAPIAVNRFGLGVRPGEMEAAAANPQRWLLEQLEGPYVTAFVLTSALSI